MTPWPNHAAARRLFREAIASGRMHHGWLLAGKRGLGKRDFALAAAREWVAEPGVPQPPGDHPDIIILTYGPKDDKGEKAQAEGKPFEAARSIRIKQIRAMQRRLFTRPTLGSRRAIIIDPADDLEKSAANALLKSLEEPPPGTIFLLVCHASARLLPTIRSRCRTVRFPVPDEGELGAMLAEAGLQATPEMLAAAGGSYGAALRFVREELGPVAKLMRALIETGDEGLSRRSELARLIGTRADRERWQAVFELARSLVVEAARTEPAAGRRARLILAHESLVALSAQAPTYNFDPGLLALEIGGLLVAAAPASAPAHG